jgi:gliding motility-associated-like protein
VLSSNIGFCLEHDSIEKNELTETYTPTTSAFFYQIDTTIKDCENWVKFSYIFKPTSIGLQHLIIGNFPSLSTQIDSLGLTDYCGSFLGGNPYGASYYLIDDVSLYCLDCDTTSPCPIATPDAFTPNADGMNDVWQPLFSNACIIDSTSYLLHIFDRWGNLIFSSNSFNEPWKGNNAPLGTYVFYLQYDEKGTTRKKQGSVELLR